MGEIYLNYMPSQTLNQSNKYEIVFSKCVSSSADRALLCDFEKQIYDGLLSVAAHL